MRLLRRKDEYYLEWDTIPPAIIHRSEGLYPGLYTGDIILEIDESAGIYFSIKHNCRIIIHNVGDIDKTFEVLTNS